MMAPSRCNSLSLPEDTSKLAEKAPMEKGWFQREVPSWPLRFSQTPVHIVAKICRAQIIFPPSLVQSAGTLEKMPSLSDAQVVNLAWWELNPLRNAYLGFHLPKPPFLKIKTVS